MRHSTSVQEPSLKFLINHPLNLGCDTITMDKMFLFPMKYASRRTGLATHSIRTWEIRYQAVIPRRSSSNRRLYTEGNIKRLQLLKKAVDIGHNISQVAGLRSEQLIRIINLNASKSGKIPEKKPKSGRTACDQFSLSLQHVSNLDTAGLRNTLDQAAVHLTRPALIMSVIVPMAIQIDEMLHNGDLKEINKIMATTIIQSFLWSMLRSFEISETAPKIAIATSVGHHDELEA